MDKEKLKQIISGVKEATSGLKIKDCEIADFALRIYISPSIEQGKDKRTEQMQPTKDKIEPMTEKQRNFLIKNEYQGNMNLSKEEAKQLIKEFIERNKPEPEY